jgi:hypothetical protein
MWPNAKEIGKGSVVKVMKNAAKNRVIRGQVGGNLPVPRQPVNWFASE